ncbi:uncharacterized protein V1510DRAFT_402974 [Dipodascopsis tothii]|uniref:uncharacterized protein n=1 Tax=Dipodascopsis tothii TaxID=44089 RepID=UPI0034CD6A44
MVKRARYHPGEPAGEDQDPRDSQLDRPGKRQKNADYLSACSDEAILLVFAALSRADVAVCSRVSRRFQTVANDNLVWKKLFYDSFVRPRLCRRPRLQQITQRQWLENSSGCVDWKSRYKLRYNWHKGRCRIKTIGLAGSQKEDLVFRLAGRSIFTADRLHGLRALDETGRTLASVPPESLDVDGLGPPTTLHVSEGWSKAQGHAGVAVMVGFATGAFSVYQYADGTLAHRFTHNGTEDCAVTAVVCEWPFLATQSPLNTVDVFYFGELDRLGVIRVTSLASQSVRGPTSLSMRRLPTTPRIYATLAYAFPDIIEGWNAAVQELELDPTTGNMVSVRSATSVTAEPPYGRVSSSVFYRTAPALPSISSVLSSLANIQRRPALAAGQQGPPLRFRLKQDIPTSLSYSHPYLLTSHDDNTLMSYMVRSTDSELSISPGRRLWGHTSGVAHVEVKQRGTAVSISKNGAEIRLWDLESAPVNGVAGESVRVDLGPSPASPTEPASTGSVGRFFEFDDEKVVVNHRQADDRLIRLYDFT